MNVKEYRLPMFDNQTLRHGIVLCQTQFEEDFKPKCLTFIDVCR